MKKTCQNCGETYEAPPSIKKKYCSQQCYLDTKPRSTTINCAVCGKKTKSYPYRPRTYCSKSCARTAANLTDRNPSYHRDISGEKNPMYNAFKNPRPSQKLLVPSQLGKTKELSPRWKGGRKVRKDGYILVVAPDDHPHPSDQHKPSGLKYILEHRLVMEQKLGRYLLPTEVVHHIDEDPSNNDPDNLMLFASQLEHVKHHAAIRRHRSR